MYYTKAISLQWWVGACNELTSEHLDPISKTPEFKYCAVTLEKIENQEEMEKEIKDKYNNIKAQFGAKLS